MSAPLDEIALNALLDELLEESARLRRTVRQTVTLALQRLCEAVGASGALLQTYDDDLSLADFLWPAGLLVPRRAELDALTGPEPRERPCFEEPGVRIVAQPLDVAGEWFGRAALLAGIDGPDPGQLARALEVACEQLDGFLFAIKNAHLKHQLTMRLGDALRHRVLADGLRQAVAVLCEALPLDRLLLVLAAEEGRARNLHVQLFEGDRLAVDTMGTLARHPEEKQILREARAYLEGDDPALVRRFSFEFAHESLLIDGISRTSLVGKLLAASRAGSINVWERELLAVFSSYIRQRVVDFNKEWRTLAASFRPEDVTRLLRIDGYDALYLSPREAEVAILFSDISGFTRLSEEVLQDPSAVARLVEAWSRDAVSLVFEHGGVFDKMVGDCVIALFGPPFYQWPSGDRLAAALRCAAAIRDMTRALPGREGLEALRGVEVGVASGVNLAPLFVGRFGPNQNFTGFSRGMNNTARLQGCAVRDEILVMSEAIESLTAGHGFGFGPERSARVKNVAEPLRFRPLA